MNRIRVLVVDDSLVFREVLARGIGSDPYIEVVGKAKDPFEARDMILEYNPDVMTCDVEMPKMNGIDFIRRLIPQYPIPVVVVSTISNAVFDAMNAGAVDFVTKPDVQSVSSVETFINNLIMKIKIAAVAKIPRVNSSILEGNINERTSGGYSRDIIAIGASTGGTEAISALLKGLSNNIPGIVIVQHIPAVFSKIFAERLDTTTAFQVKEAETGDYVQQGKVLIAPGDKHMRIKKFGGQYRVECFEGGKVNGHCPSVDILFESLANASGNKAIGIILTGMGYDGAKGLLAMKRKGARTIGQDEKSSVVYGMPKVAFEIGGVDKQTSLSNIPQVLYSFMK